MAGQACTITSQEMNAFLSERGFCQIDPARLAGVHEVVYGKLVKFQDRQYSLRVYTSIQGGVSRAKGSDAIRVALFVRNSVGDIKMVGGSARVHRITTWRLNLEDRISRWMDHLGHGFCKKCQMPLVERTNRKTKGKFIGCSGFPQCSD